MSNQSHVFLQLQMAMSLCSGILANSKHVVKDDSQMVTYCYFLGVYVLLRAANVFGCVYLVNLARTAHMKLPMTHQRHFGTVPNYSTLCMIIDATGIDFRCCQSTGRCFLEVVGDNGDASQVKSNI
ncbi:hypothetical protein YC2023_017554 [Brassica napus]